MTHFYGATSLTGGGTGALDSISGALLVNNDVCLVDYSGVLVTYILDAASGLAESSPTIIAPDTSPGTKRWLLQSTAYSILTAGSDSFPVALAIPISTLVGRKSTGAIVALSKSDALTILNVADGATANAKATGAELDTGTDDAKFSTAKALKDSHNVPSVVPGAAWKILRSDGTDWVSSDLTAPPPFGTVTPNLVLGTNIEIYKTASAGSPLTAAQVSGTIVSNYGMTDADCVISLPTAALGYSFVLILPAVRARYFKLRADTNDKFYLAGVAGSDNGYVGVASGYVTGVACSFFTFKASDGNYDWFAIPIFGSWVAS
jgi:hypothetical protein